MDTSTKIMAHFAGQEVVTQVEVQYFSKTELLIRAARALGICWAVALVSIFIPVLHFVIVPLAILMGPLAAILVFFKGQKLPKILNGAVDCAHCKQTTKFSFTKATPPFYSMCQHCQTGYQIQWPPSN